MAGHDHRGQPPSPEALKAGHEVAEITTRPIAVFLIVIVVISALSFLAMYGFFRYLAADAARRSPKVTTLARQGDTRLPPEPRLQVYPDVDWAAYRASQDSLLTSYAWVDKDSLIVRVPVARAAEMVLRRGLPARPVAPPDWLRPSTGLVHFGPASGAAASGHAAPASGHPAPAEGTRP